MNKNILTFFLIFFCSSSICNALIFRSGKFKAHWDTWCFYHNETYYTYYLITEYSYGEGIGLAASKDGVHWKDHGLIISASEKEAYYMGSGYVYKSPDFDNTGKFLMNYSEHRLEEDGKRTQNIFFAWSKDLISWNKYGDEKIFKVDTRYYKKYGRWDCIFTFPRKEGGLWGTWSANSLTRKGSVGIGYSLDGVSWKCLPAPEVEIGAKEAGAFYPIEDKLYAMFIASPDRGIWGYVSDQIEGPYNRQQKNAHITKRGPTAFARFFPTPNGLLANHYHWTGKRVPKQPNQVGRLREITYISPFKRIEVDHEGIMRWKYWEGNDALKGKFLVFEKSDNNFRTGELDFNKGVIVEADINMPQKIRNPVTFNFYAAGKKYQLRIKQNGITEMESPEPDAKGWAKLLRTDRQCEFGNVAQLRIYLRAGMMEVYLDDHYIASWTMFCHGEKTINIISPDIKSITNIKLWQMSLGSCNTNEMPESK